SYVLLVVSMLMRDISKLRILVIASALAGIAYDLFWLRNPVGVFWEGLLLLVNLIQLYLLWRRDRGARFTQEERQFTATRLQGLAPGACRELLDMGEWISLPEATYLAVQDESPRYMTLLSAGKASVQIGQREVATVEDGQYVGEMSALDGGLASANVITTQRSRVWRIETGKIEWLKRERQTTANALFAGIALELRRKIVAGNVELQRRPKPVLPSVKH
ncbi:MAG: cyclic nucleotide-binding domain-containing protein, partial [Pseudomonadota bacterium]